MTGPLKLWYPPSPKLNDPEAQDVDRQACVIVNWTWLPDRRRHVMWPKRKWESVKVVIARTEPSAEYLYRIILLLADVGRTVREGAGELVVEHELAIAVCDDGVGAGRSGAVAREHCAVGRGDADAERFPAVETGAADDGGFQRTVIRPVRADCWRASSRTGKGRRRGVVLSSINAKATMNAVSTVTGNLSIHGC